MALARPPKGYSSVREYFLKNPPPPPTHGEKFIRGLSIVLSLLFLTLGAGTWLWIIFSIGITTGVIVLGSIALIIISSYIVGNFIFKQ